MHLAHYYRYLWEAANCVVVTGDASEIWKGREAYNSRFEIPEDAPAECAALGRLLGTAGLAAVSCAEREWWGWSVAIPGTCGGFFCGVEPEGRLCGRVLESEKQKDFAVVQRQHKGSPVTQSHFSLRSQDPADAVERYFEDAEQTLVRLALNDDGMGVFLRPLPGGGFNAMQGLSDDDLIEHCARLVLEGAMKKLDEVLLFYDCPCNDYTVRKMIEGLPRDQREALWGGLDMIEVTCPRCGRRHAVQKEQQA